MGVFNARWTATGIVILCATTILQHMQRESEQPTLEGMALRLAQDESLTH